MNNRGFTLIEVLVATIVATILLTAILAFLTQRVAQNAQQSARDDMLRDTQLTLNVMMDDVRHGANANEENRWPDPHHPEGEYGWSSDEDTLVLSRPAVDSDNNFIYRDPFTYVPYKNDIIFFVEDQTLYKRTLAADTEGDGENAANSTCPESTSGCQSDAQLAENVNSLDLRYIDADGNDVEPNEARAVEAALELTDTVYGNDITVDYSTRGVFRN